MRKKLEQLRELQEINCRIQDLRRDRERLSIDIENQAEVLEEKESRREQTHQTRIEKTKLADRTQLEIEKAEQECERLETQLNTVQNQREYDAIQHSLSSRQADIQKWEDEALMALDTADRLSKEEERLAEEVEEARAELQRIREEVADRTEELDRQIEEFQQEREQIRSELDPELLTAYDRIASRHPRDALAEVDGRICGGCHTQITKQTKVLLARENKLVHCHSCGRLLMLADE